jgi:hypothetical protein
LGRFIGPEDHFAFILEWLHLGLTFFGKFPLQNNFIIGNGNFYIPMEGILLPSQQNI